jgi:hypothetical protein
MLCLDNDYYESSNIGGYLPGMYSKPSSSRRTTSTKVVAVNMVNVEFNNKIKVALNKIFDSKPINFYILNRDLKNKLSGKFRVNDKMYIATFNNDITPLKKSILSNRDNWNIQIETTEKDQNFDLIPLLEDITIDIIALDSKETEKRAHFTTLLPSVIDDIFKKIGNNSVLKKDTTFQKSENLFLKMSGIVKMNDIDYYRVLFNVSKDKVDINDLKNINHWLLIPDVPENRRQIEKLFENNRNADFSAYKTILSTIGFTSFLR